ncbi:MAG: DNA polymerase IV [Candidatus Paceibacterota bacterium]|jgi:DNA polymerase IV (DinB-like DNA polymerase)
MRIIAHLDMDAFFASVEERDNPRFRNLPLVVGSDPLGGKGRGVVSTANYRARKYGIRSALPISKAWEYAEQARREGKPPVIFLGVDMEKYSRVSEHIRALVLQLTPKIEQASIDEIYCDVSEYGSFEKAERTCVALQKKIQKEEHLSCSLGIGPNKLVAKIASDFKKPLGLTVVRPDNVLQFLAPLSIRKMPGIGPKMEEILHAKKVNTIEDIQKYSLEEMKEELGKWGEAIFFHAHGSDDTPVTEEYETKSIGEQETFLRDTSDVGEVAVIITKLSSAVFQRFKKSEFVSFRRIAVTVRFADFKTVSRSHAFEKTPQNEKEFIFEVMKILLPFFDARENPHKKKFRLLGVRVEQFK